MILLAASLAPLNAGCGGGGGAGREEAPAGAGEVPPAGEITAEEGTGASTRDVSTLHMCGRSVLAGWFEHWGWDYDPAHPVHFAGFELVYHEMDTPPGILDTAREAIREVSREGGGALFFKLCFADFAGGDEDTARSNLEDNKRIVRAVADAALGEGLLLILGNALPMVREYTDEWLTWSHREYNRFLAELAAAHPGRIAILDLYGTLAAPGGWLRPEYALDPYDSHLNDAAYAALDPVLARVLDAL
jgi:sugar phosphate isomerase/epimerase